VTGSLYLMEAGASRVLVDCGIFQGRDEDRRNAETFPFDPIGVDAVLLTHAHLDHSGRIPLLAKRGFHGRIYATSPTVELCDVLWRDSTRLMRRKRSGAPGKTAAAASLPYFLCMTKRM